MIDNKVHTTEIDTPFTFSNMMMLQVAKNQWNHKK